MGNNSETSEQVPSARRFAWPRVTWVALLLLVAGSGLVVGSGAEQVTSVRVSQGGLAIPPLMSSPDYYVALVLDDDSRIETTPYQNTPIGNGLSFDLPAAVSLANIAQVVLYDSDPLQDDMLDHADVDGQTCDGQSFTFHFIGSRSPLFTAGIVVIVLGGLGLAYVVVLFVHAHAL